MLTSLILKKIKVVLCDHHAICMPVYSHINFQMPEPVFMKLTTSMYIMTLELIKMAYFINPSRLSMCRYV
jgi:hypothetical protein